MRIFTPFFQYLVYWNIIKEMKYQKQRIDENSNLIIELSIDKKKVKKTYGKFFQDKFIFDVFHYFKLHRVFKDVITISTHVSWTVILCWFLVDIS